MTYAHTKVDLRALAQMLCRHHPRERGVVAERSRLFADNHIRQTIVDGPRRAGWTVERSIERFPEGSPNDLLFDYAAKQGAVLVTNDQLIHALAMSWMESSRSFRMVFWK